MLLRAGLAMAALSVLLAAVVALLVVLRAKDPVMQSVWAKPSASETTSRENGSNSGEKLEVASDRDSGSGSSAGNSAGSDPGDGPGAGSRREESNSRLEIPSRDKGSGTSSSSGEKSAPSRQGGSSGLLPVSAANWPVPSREELVQLISEPRYFDPNPGASMTLTIEALGLYDVPVFDSFGEEALDLGIMHVPDTGYPWDGTDQKNVFLAGHRVGLPGTDGRLLFFALDELEEGDMIFIEDRDGNAYAYEFSEMFRVEPEDAWVADTLADRDLLTLQTCTYPTFEDRLIVRADRV